MMVDVGWVGGWLVVWLVVVAAAGGGGGGGGPHGEIHPNF